MAINMKVLLKMENMMEGENKLSMTEMFMKENFIKI
jgi:hypothetical protein